jgi:hypothetical protein
MVPIEEVSTPKRFIATSERLPLSIKIKYNRKTEQPEEVMFCMGALTLA